MKLERADEIARLADAIVERYKLSKRQRSEQEIFIRMVLMAVDDCGATIHFPEGSNDAENERGTTQHEHTASGR